MRTAPHRAAWAAGRPRRVRRASSSYLERRGDIDYLGWVGQDNLGDEAIHDALSSRLAPLRLTGLPMTDFAETVARIGAGSTGRRPALLGGGTLLGRRDWRERVEATERHLRPTGWSVLGAGVDDPSFAGKARGPSASELAAWAPVLARFDQVSVRGPRSAELLAGIGVGAEVVGDTALLLADDAPWPDVEPDLLALSVAHPVDVWGGDQDAVVGTVAVAARGLVDKGLRLRLLALHPKDVAACRAVQAALPKGAPAELVVPATAQDCMRALRPCAAVVGQRLHAVVLGAAAHVPGLALAYHPKLAEFQDSLGREEWTLPTLHLDADEVVRRTLELLAAREQDRAAVTLAVGGLLDRLERSVTQLAGRLRPGPASAPDSGGEGRVSDTALPR